MPPRLRIPRALPLLKAGGSTGPYIIVSITAQVPVEIYNLDRTWICI